MCSICGNASFVGFPERKLFELHHTCGEIDQELRLASADFCASTIDIRADIRINVEYLCGCEDIPKPAVDCNLCGPSGRLAYPNLVIEEPSFTCQDFAFIAEAAKNEESCRLLQWPSTVCCELPSTDLCSICPNNGPMKYPNRSLLVLEDKTCYGVDRLLRDIASCDV